MKKRLKTLAARLGIEEIGIVSAKIFHDYKEILEKRGSVSLAEPDVEKRINPFITMPRVKSIIVCLFSYNVRKKGNISSYAFGTDYHIVLKKKLEQLSKPLTENGYLAECFADTGALSDRYLAYNAGLGFYGKNGMLINKKLGSWFFIGYIMTDCEMEEDKPSADSMCIGCGKCIKACPSGAIKDGFEFDEKLCASYITQKKGELSSEEQEIIKKSGYIWGCDICQKVCPHNIDAAETDIDEFKNNLICNLEIDENISNREFKRMYGDRAFSWRGKSVLIRNKNLFK